MDGGSFLSKEVGDTVSLGLSKVPGIEQVLDVWITIHVHEEIAACFIIIHMYKGTNLAVHVVWYVPRHQ